MATIYRFVGMNNVKDPANIAPIPSRNPIPSYSEMTEIVNFDCDNDGKAKTRRGSTLVYPTAVHSGWTDGKACLFVDNGYLKQLLTDETIAILGIVGAGQMSYAALPDGILCSNGRGIWFLKGGSLDPLSLEDDRAFKAILPAGQVLAYVSGRVLCGVGRSILYTDAYSLCIDTRKCEMPVKSQVTMIQAVDSGFYVSDQDGVYWHNGLDPTQEGLLRVTTDGDPALPGGSLPVEAKYFGLDGVTGKVAVWYSTRGFCIGTNSGQVINISKDRVAVAVGKAVSLSFRKINGFYQLLAVTRDNAAPDNPFINKSITVDKRVTN
jgi:hypothetical protein